MANDNLPQSVTSSSPPPTIIKPTAVPAPLGPPKPVPAPKLAESIEIKAPAGITPGIPLSELSAAVANAKKQQQQPAPAPSAPAPVPATAPAHNEKVEATSGRGHSSMLGVGLAGIQVIALIAVLFGFLPPLLWQTAMTQIIGALLVGAGILLAIWSLVTFRQRVHLLPSPDPNGFLVTGGPYAYVRHPMYLSILIGGFGLCLAYPNLLRLAAYAVLVMVLLIKIEYEEQLLATRYSGYDKYRAHTGRLLPKFKLPEQLELVDMDQEAAKNEAKKENLS